MTADNTDRAHQNRFALKQDGDDVTPTGARVYDINGNYPDMTASNKERAHQNRRAFAVANELGLGDMERRELAMMLPTQTGASGPVSWAALSIAELGLLADWMTGVIRLRELANLRAVPGRGD